jgi:prepilin-type N-terminal cleavage/methylation domain-containing protein
MTEIRKRRCRGFTLVELAVVVAIVALLLGSLMYTLSAQTDQRGLDETRRRLDHARELLLNFAAVNGRLPCPARSIATAAPVTQAGDEVRDASGACTGDAVTDYYGGASGGVALGLLPARTLGLQPVDAAGFAVDAWGNRIRYAVSGAAPTNCNSPPATPHFTHAANLKANGVSCQPNDLIVCKSAAGITATTCGGAANQIMSQNLVVALVLSTGKNGASGAAGADEIANVNGDRVFVWHTPTGDFDDLMTWLTHGEVYGRMIAAGVLP